MKIEQNPHKVADLLKSIVNQQCEEGFQWFPDVKASSCTLFDLLGAIDVLECSEIHEMEMIVDDECKRIP